MSRFDKYLQKLAFAVICFVTSVIPLVVHVKKIPLGGIPGTIFQALKIDIDFFSWWKLVFLSLCCFLLILPLVIQVSKDKPITKIKLSIFLLSGAYVSLVFLSSFLSKYPRVSLFGFVGLYEGALAIVMYMIIMLSSLYFVNSDKSMQRVLDILLLSGTIIAVIGLFQFFGKDPFRVSFLRDWIGAKHMANNIFKLSAGGHIYGTLSNPNFVGSYAAMLIPLSLSFFLSTKQRIKKGFYFMITAMMLILGLGCHSRAGMLGWGTGSLMSIALLWKNVSIKDLGVLLGCFAVVFFLIFQKITFSSLWPRDRRDLELLDIRSGQVVLKTKKAGLLLIPSEEGFNIRDLTMRSLTLNKNGAKIKIAESGYENIELELLQGDKMDKNIKLKIFLENRKKPLELSLALTKEGFKVFVWDGLYDSEVPKIWNFLGRETTFSHRSYIWRRTIPLITDKILLGGGPGTFPMEFPQRDFLGKLMTFDSLKVIVDKPHNMYLQIIHASGMLSLVCLFILWGLVGFCTLRIIRFENSRPLFNKTLPIAVFSAICGYLIAGFFNDSTMSVAVVFWPLVGLGLREMKTN